MKNSLKIFLLLGGVILFLGGLAFWQARLSKTKEEVPKQSQFQAEIEEAAKREEEAKKKEEEKKRQEEETRKFIATYGPCRNIPILMYHHIGDQSGSLWVRKEIFLSQMDYLAQKGYNSVTLPEVVESLASGKALPAKSVVLTFDDGYRDFYENAYPILKSHNFKATLFVISQFVGGSDYVTWPQLQEMVSSSLVTAGNHTLSHLSLSLLSEEKLRDQILSAKNIIEQNLGISVNVFAYPYGGTNGEAEKILKEGGFAAAVKTGRGLSCAKLPYELPRVRIGNSSLSSYGL